MPIQLRDWTTPESGLKALVLVQQVPRSGRGPRGWSGAKLSMLRSQNTRVAHLPEVVASARPIGDLDQISVVRCDAIVWAGWGDEAIDQKNLRRT
jgi:hypothetical protein